jgi:hypothetical protein
MELCLIRTCDMPGISSEVRKWGRYLTFDCIGLGNAPMGKPMDQVKAFAASNAMHYVRQLISIVGRYGTLDKEFTALMDQLIAAYNKVKR